LRDEERARPPLFSPGNSAGLIEVMRGLNVLKNEG
jgi:hypothetical protein